MFEIAEDVKEEEDEEPVVERPRSYSLPNLAYSSEGEEYQYEITRDFRLEL